MPQILRYSLYLFLSALLLQSCRKSIQPQPNLNRLSVNFRFSFGKEDLKQDQAFTTAQGEPISIRVFKYYLSRFSLVNDAGREILIDSSHYLTDAFQTPARSVSLSVPDGSYRQLRFWVGVDSALNVSGVQQGDLDPAKGMFWTWNTGYIFAKLEGRSPVSPAPLQGFTYHIGGFRTGENARRNIAISFPETLVMRQDANRQLLVQVDAAQWFAGTHPVRVSVMPSVMDPGTQAMQLADNYSGMFSFVLLQ